MRKIFDLFLFLLMVWLFLMLGTKKFDIYFVISGFFSAALVAFASFALGLINQESEFLFLNLSFYRHFINCYFANFWRSLNLIFQLAIGARSTHPLTQNTKIPLQHSGSEALLIASVNMIAGLMVVAANEEYLKIYAIDENCLDYLDLTKTSIRLQKINEEELI